MIRFRSVLPLAAPVILAAVHAQAADLTARPGAVDRPAYGETHAAADPRHRLTQRDRDALKELAEAGIAQIEASQYALSRPVHPDVREFAERMLAEHTRTHEKLQRLARAMGVVLPHQPSVFHRSKLRLLDLQHGAAFEGDYLEDFGVLAHAQTLDRVQTVLEQSKNVTIRAFARQVLPGIQQHLLRARSLYASQPRLAEPNAGDGRPGGRPSAPGGDAIDAAHETLAEAVQVVQRMKGDPGVTALLRQARGVFIVPTFGRAALGIGIRGGVGVLVARTGAGFSNPVFYRLGGMSVGAQAGVSRGEIALLLMTDKAVRAFRSDRTFWLSADAGLTFADYSRRARASAGKLDDVVVWSGAEGAYAGVSVGLGSAVYDAEANSAYYGTDALDPGRILDGPLESSYSNVLGIVLSI